MPDYDNLSRIHRLNSLALAAAVVDDGDNLALLREAIDKQRFALADAATIIEKMIGVTMLHFDLELYAALLALPGVAEQHEPLPALDAEERSLRQAFITEFAAASAVLDGSLSVGDSSWVEDLMVGLYFKPRKLENHAHEDTWMRMLALESRPLAERARLATSTSYGWWDRYTDPVGYLLYEISRPASPHIFHNRLEHLDGLITLVNSAAHIYRRSLQGEAIAAYAARVDAAAHPGYAGARIRFDAASNELYIEIPGYDSASDSPPMDRIPRLRLDLTTDA
jgi:hypothetical protein